MSNESDALDRNIPNHPPAQIDELDNEVASISNDVPREETAWIFPRAASEKSLGRAAIGSIPSLEEAVTTFLRLSVEQEVPQPFGTYSLGPGDEFEFEVRAVEDRANGGSNATDTEIQLHCLFCKDETQNANVLLEWKMCDNCTSIFLIFLLLLLHFCHKEPRI